MLSLLLRYTARGTWKLFRLFVLLFVLLAAAGLLTLRYWVLPQVERYHMDIELAASAELGRKVSIGRIEADWHGFRPRLLLSDVRMLDEQGRVALEFPLLRNTVAWTTFFLGELRFHSLELDSPQIEIRRDVGGRYSLGGITSEGRTNVRPDGRVADWLLHQSLIVVRNGRIVWQDEMRVAPPVVFDKIDLVVENRHGRHRFALNATPPPELGAPVDLRADLYGDSFADSQGWHGEFYARVDHADLSAWRRWFDLPSNLSQGGGGLRLWLGMEAGKLTRVEADVDLHDVSARLQEQLPELALQRMHGHLGWRQSASGFEVSGERLSLRLRDGFMLHPTTFLFNLSARSGYRSASGEMKVDALDLSDINRLLVYLPVADDIRRKFADLAPQGHVKDLEASWQGDQDKLLRYKVRARFDQIGLRQTGDLPGVSGVSGWVEGSDSDGQLSLDSRNLRVEAPGFLSEPLFFERFYGKLDWQRNSQQGWDLKLNKVLISNADAEGTIHGSYQLNEGAGIADLTVNLTRVEVKHAARYIPVHAFNEQTYRWLQTGLQGGIADSFMLRVRGDLQEFPFPDDRNGQFRLSAKARDVAIEFDPGWPRIEKAKADLLIQGRLLEVRASQAETAGAAVQNVRVALPDTLADKLVMEVEGEAAGPTEDCLDYIRRSPVRGYLNGYTDDFHAKGRGLLRLRLDIPLDGDAHTRVKGSYRVDDNELDLGGYVPLLRQVSGTLHFTGETIQADGVAAQILGGPARLSLRNEREVLRIKAGGTLDAGSLYPVYGYPLLRRLHGKTGWQADIDVKDRLADVRVSSDLQGVTSTLPPPFDKAAGQRVALHFEQKDLDARNDVLRLGLGDIFMAEFARSLDRVQGWQVRRGDIVLGDAQPARHRDGIWLSGHLPYLALQGWSGLFAMQDRANGLPDIAGIDVRVDAAQGYGNTLHDLRVRGSGRNGLISTRLGAREASGDLIWQPQEEGKLYVRLKHLTLGENDAALPALPEPQEEVREPSVPLSLPEIDLAVERLSWKGRQLGKLEMLMVGEEGDAVLRRLRLTNPDGTVNASGRWRPLRGETQLSTRIEIADAGKILSRSGYPESLSGGGGVLESELNWRGAPDAFDYGSLNGSLRLKIGKGRFLQVDPGAAKLLGVLSLQSLPKRIALDFTDVFTPGFEFDGIAGDAIIQNGLLRTDNFVLSGSAAKVTLQGEVDLQRETQALKVRVLPAIGDNVSLLSFAAGPAVGVGVLLTNKLLRDPLDKLVSFDYNVSGSWADPRVERIGIRQAP